MKFSRNFFGLAVILAGVAAHAEDPRGGDSLPTDSIYQLRVNVADQNGNAVGLDVYYGQPTLVTMFYASCPHVCPMIVSTIKLTESKLSSEERADLRVLAISIDPERDTPDILKETMQRHSVEADRWSMVRPEPGKLRAIAGVLGVKYKQLPDGQFSHSTKIVLLDRTGRQIASTQQLGRYDAEFLKAIRKSLE